MAFSKSFTNCFLTARSFGYLSGHTYTDLYCSVLINRLLLVNIALTGHVVLAKVTLTGLAAALFFSQILFTASTRDFSVLTQFEKKLANGLLHPVLFCETKYKQFLVSVLLHHNSSNNFFRDKHCCSTGVVASNCCAVALNCELFLSLLYCLHSS